MSDNAIVVGEYHELVLPVASVKSRYQQMAAFAAEVMRSDVDFGRIPGVDKPTLLKPGAEKLTVLFGLEARFTLADRLERFEDPAFFFYRYECALFERATGLRIANAFGSCNSREKKYRFRRIPSWEATAADERLAIRVEERKSKAGNQVKFFIVENPDLCDLVNTFDKMAQKRALVAAVLVGTGASEFFTQDVEDLAEFAAETPRPAGPPHLRTVNPNPAPAPASSSPAPGMTTAEWLSKHSKIIMACREAYGYLSPMQIAERLSSLGIDPAAGDGAALAALNTPASAAPDPAPEPATGPAVTADMAPAWLAELQQKVQGATGSNPPSEKMVKFALVLFNQCFPQAACQEARDLVRHEFLGLVNARPSLTDWSFGQVKVLLDALTTPGADGKSSLDPLAAGYVRQVCQAAVIAAGQQGLFPEATDG